MIRCPRCSSFVPVHPDAPATCPECGASPTVDTTHAERPHAKRPLGSKTSLARRAANVALGVHGADADGLLRRALRDLRPPRL